MARIKEEAAEHADETGNGPASNQNRRLVALVRKRLQDRQLTERWLCDAMQITQIYWRAIANGSRPIVGLPKEKLAVIGELLEMPVVQVYTLGGRFTAEDFVVTKDLDRQLRASWEKMKADPEWMHLAPNDDDWASTPRAVLIALVAMYERVSGQDMLSSVAVERAQA